MICTILSNGEELFIKNKNEEEKPYLLIKSQIKSIVWTLFCNGYDEFYLNCEYGVPLWAAEIICSLKKIYPIKLHIIMPYENQAVDWYEQHRDRFFYIHMCSDDVYMISTHYHDKC